jgi:hypothetical protein
MEEPTTGLQNAKLYSPEELAVTRQLGHLHVCDSCPTFQGRVAMACCKQTFCDETTKCLLLYNVKVRLHKTIILPVALYGCETWCLTTGC